MEDFETKDYGDFIFPILGIIAAVAMMIAVMIRCGGSVKHEVVSGFDVNKYLGKWYEIARFDRSFEKDCDFTLAEYTIRKDGKINVRNICKRYGKKSLAKGVAKFATSDKTKGALKVSFFRPFYGSYNIIYLDKDYKFAIVCGKNYDLLWILSRTPKIDKSTKKELVEIAKKKGFDVSKLYFTKQK